MLWISLLFSLCVKLYNVLVLSEIWRRADERKRYRTRINLLICRSFDLCFSLSRHKCTGFLFLQNVSLLLVKRYILVTSTLFFSSFPLAGCYFFLLCFKYILFAYFSSLIPVIMITLVVQSLIYCTLRLFSDSVRLSLNVWFSVFGFGMLSCRLYVFFT